MELELRQAGLDELETIMDWRMRVLKEVFAPIDEAELPMLRAENEAYYKKHLPEGSHLCYFVEDSETKTIAGCAAICLWQEMPSPDNPSGQCAYFMNVYIDPQFRHNRLGRWLVESLLQECKKRKITKIYLETTDMARRLYETCGFQDLRNYLIYDPAVRSIQKKSWKVR